VLMRFIASTAIRVPSVRDEITKMTEAGFRQHLRFLAENPEQLALVTARLRAEDPNLPDFTIESLEYAIDSGNAKSHFPQNFHMLHLLRMLEYELDSLVSALKKRKWSLYVADEGTGGF